MARLRVRGYLVNDDTFPDYEISAQDLIDKFIGDDTGAPLQGAGFYLDTDDGYRVTISIAVPKQPRHGPREEPAGMRASVARVANSGAAG